MDTTTIIIIAVVALVALFLYNRSRPAARGTYDDKDVRSSGSIGGGTRAYDDEKVRSSGSIGGGTRAYDAPDTRSSGTIGGNPNTQSASAQREREERIENDATLNKLNNDNSPRLNENLTREHAEKLHKNDDERFRSKGSIGG